MAQLPSRFRRLDDALADLPGEDEPMLLTELDGFLAGVLLCPELILPGEWLPVVWGGGGADPPFEDADEARYFITMVTAHSDEIARGLGRGRYRPLFEIDERNGDVLWELWIEGFAKSTILRPDSWLEIGGRPDGEAAAAALACMIALIDIAGDASDLPRDEIDALTEAAPDLITGWAAELHAWRIAQHGALPVAESRPAKIGRNDPCGCGSGKKWKRCCGLN